jgi:hypothetical protein
MWGLSGGGLPNVWLWLLLPRRELRGLRGLWEQLEPLLKVNTFCLGVAAGDALLCNKHTQHTCAEIRVHSGRIG